MSTVFLAWLRAWAHLWLILGRMRFDVDQRLEYGLRCGRRSGQRIAMRMISILIGCVGHLNGHALLGGKAIFALDIVVSIARLLGDNAIRYIIAISKVAMAIVLMQLLRLGMGVIVVGAADGKQHSDNQEELQDGGVPAKYRCTGAQVLSILTCLYMLIFALGLLL